RGKHQEYCEQESLHEGSFIYLWFGRPDGMVRIGSNTVQSNYLRLRLPRYAAGVMPVARRNARKNAARVPNPAAAATSSTASFVLRRSRWAQAICRSFK